MGLLDYMKRLDPPVMLLLHCKDALLPTLLAKLTHYKLLGRLLSVFVGADTCKAVLWISIDKDSKLLPGILFGAKKFFCEWQCFGSKTVYFGSISGSGFIVTFGSGSEFGFESGMLSKDIYWRP